MLSGILREKTAFLLDFWGSKNRWLFANTKSKKVTVSPSCGRVYVYVMLNLS